MTVARGMAKGTYNKIRGENTFVEILQAAIENGKEYLKRTPDMLPALKAAGVVDAGGQGLIVFFEGCVAGIQGKDCEVLPIEKSTKPMNRAQNIEPLDLEFPYCTEFIVKGANVTKQTVADALTVFGNSMIVAVMDDIVKVHIHTKHPGDALNKAQEWGTLHDIKINNMVDEHEEKLFKSQNAAPAPVTKSGVGVLTVAAGDGIAKIMHQLGAADIISGGQSMNPPVADFVNAIENGSCEQYIILPNNKNIVMAAQQCIGLTEKNVIVIPSATVPQGISAMMNVNFDASAAEEISQAMSGALSTVTTVQITYAARNSDFDGFDIQQGDYLALAESALFGTDKDLDTLLQRLAQAEPQQNAEFINIFYGEDVTEDDAEKALKLFQEACPSAEVSLLPGGQPVYYYMISAE